MTASRANEGTVRPTRFEMSRLAWAFVISLLLHLTSFGTYEAGKKFGWWNMAHWPVWLQKVQQLAKHVAPPKNQKPPVENQETPLVFVDVNPLAATAEPPKNAKFYSARNSQAANIAADKDTGIPKLTGKQEQIAKTEDTDRSPFDKLQPDFNALKAQREEQERRQKSSKPPGDLAMTKPQLTVGQDGDAAEQQPRPRTIREALARRSRNQLAGEQMKQDGGVSRLRLVPGFDVRATPFGAYDAALIEAVEQRWFDLLDNISYNGYRRGKVVVQFRLNYDGRITDMKVADNSVSEMLGLLCEKAVLDPAPYDRWPQEMRQMVDKDYRDITFTFFYN